jgi:hypothetical protein
MTLNYIMFYNKFYDKKEEKKTKCGQKKNNNINLDCFINYSILWKGNEHEPGLPNQEAKSFNPNPSTIVQISKSVHFFLFINSIDQLSDTVRKMKIQKNTGNQFMNEN